MSNTTYSNKSNCQRAAKRRFQTLERLTFSQDTNNRWYWIERGCEETHCPDCGAELDEHTLHTHSAAEPHEKGLQFECTACGHEFGPEVAPVHEHIEASELRGYRYPSEGTKCRELWDYFDNMRAEESVPKPKMVKEAFPEVNPHTCSTQLYGWRRYHGLSRPVRNGLWG